MESCLKCGRVLIPSHLLHAMEVSGGAAVANTWIPMIYTPVICLLPSGLKKEDLVNGIGGWCDISAAIFSGKPPEEVNKVGGAWRELRGLVEEVDWHTNWVVPPDLLGWLTVLTTAVSALLNSGLCDKEAIMALARDAVSAVDLASIATKEGRVTKLPGAEASE
jgi:hypothetical protein